MKKINGTFLTEIATTILFVAFVASMIIFTAISNDATGERFDYEKHEEAISWVYIYDEVNVRSEPVRIEEKDGRSNSFGKLTEIPLEMDLQTVYELEEPYDEANGYFVGFLIEEVLATPEGRNTFPSGIKDDPDGIVWIQRNYVAYGR